LPPIATKGAPYNVIEITEDQLTAENLQMTINYASGTQKNDLIVVRTTAMQGKITLGGA